ncbi:50S ribosomal protein L24 [Patescibacteria group bacterium]|nr:50S ribosomal protein L24 [Patescibacteria group bacterium]MBU1123466.1 50S ribosomal protein L24 [Patescibacteria group bacterium]MBU1911840.1 50S ribosomal protein L24 [Patescibacteria group bacterium]
MKLHAGDSVVVISGKDKGKTGKILKVLGNGRLIVADINMRTKHIKSQPNRIGQIIRYEASLDASNVMILDPKTNKRSRIGFERDEKGGKKRIAKRSGEVVVAGKVPEKKEEEGKKEVKEAKEGKGEKVIKATKETKEGKKAERVDAPDKKAFWKGLGFGSEALEEDDLKEIPHMKEDHSVPDQGRTTDSFTHKRGG